MTEAAEVFLLVVEVGRTEGDDLPEGSEGAALLCYTAAPTEKRAVDDTVDVLRQAGLAPLEVAVHGTRSEPGDLTLDAETTALMDRATAENAVVVAQITPFWPDD
ncbi:MAG: hypothetical protein AAFW69_11780 [Pseudomonadota bacterium]